MRKYEYKILRYDKAYIIDLESIINYATKDGERLVNVDYTPRDLMIILEIEVNKE